MAKYLIIAVISLGVLISAATQPVSFGTVAVMAVAIVAMGISVEQVLDWASGGEENG